LIAFNADSTPAKSFTDVDGRAVTVRPVYDSGLNRTVVELVVHGATVRLSPGVIPGLSDIIVMAAALAEVNNLVDGNPSKLGE
jgi:hypothetical protein